VTEIGSLLHGGWGFQNIASSLQDLLCCYGPHPVHRVLQVGDTPGLVITQGALDIHMIWLGKDDFQYMCTSIRLDLDKEPVIKIFFVFLPGYLEHHVTSHHICCCLGSTYSPGPSLANLVANKKMND